MKTLLVPDKFKGSLSALEVCDAIKRGLKNSKPNLEIYTHPMADGGDGSLDILSNYLELKKHFLEVVDPIGRKIKSTYFTSGESAFIEMANASGLILLAQNERNPMLTSTLGTGQIIVDALNKGCRHFFLFLGGSATNDAAIGIAHALGFRFLNKGKNELFPNGENLSKIHRIQPPSFFDYSKIKMTLLSDVNNPLFGYNGAAYVYAKQKGATENQIKKLDDGLRHFSKILFDQFGVSVGNLPGGGAAGGVGAGMVGMFGAHLKPGFDTIAELTNLEEKIKTVDYVISGEGQLDEQSLQGKVIDGLTRLCRKHGKPISLFVGENKLDEEATKALGVEHVFSILAESQNVEDAMAKGADYLELMGRSFGAVILSSYIRNLKS